MPKRSLYSEIVAPANTPQSEQAHPAQTPNSAGGWSFKVDKWTQARRFLILGSEKGTYYIGEKPLTLANMQAVLACIQEDGTRLVDLVCAVSDGGLAAKNSPAIFALALACSPKYASPATVAYALAHLPYVARTATHLFEFVETVQTFRGWGRGLRRAIGNWFTRQPPNSVAYQMIKYRQRNGWTGRDVLRLAHMGSMEDEMQAIFRWVVGAPLTQRNVKRAGQPVQKVMTTNDTGITGTTELGNLYPDVSESLPELIRVFEVVQKLHNFDEIAALVKAHGLPREALPTEALNSPVVWAALLQNMPYTALMRNLATMTRVGLLGVGSGDLDAVMLVCLRLVEEKAITKARVHPIAILAALKTYAQGHGMRGQNTWTPNPRIIDALDKAYYLSFANVQPFAGRVKIAIDISGSMKTTSVVGLEYLTAREGAAALALPMLAAMPNAWTEAFNTDVKPLHLSSRQRLDDATLAIERLISGGTNCAAPIMAAIAHKEMVDCFVIITDSETWQGTPHPHQALEQYRKAVNPAAKLAVIAMCSNSETITNTDDDAGVINLVGFDTQTPVLLDAFLRGEV